MPVESLFFMENLSPLYEAVQSGDVFPDSKFFVDCTPKMATEAILSAYQESKNKPGFDLKKFVSEHFHYPEIPATDYQSANRPLVEHLEKLWDVLSRPPGRQEGTLIALPNPYIVPGGRFREVYYWDSYFTMLGLQVSKRTDIIQNMVDNFAYLIDQVGFIPNGNRTYYLGRSQPPFFALMVQVLRQEKGDEILLKYRPQLEKEYQFWMNGEDALNAVHPCHRRVVQMDDGVVLNRYFDDQDRPRPEAYAEDMETAHHSGRNAETVFRHIRAAAESGWDFSTRWFADGQHMETIQTTDLIPVDLNCLLLYLEKTLLEAYAIMNEDVRKKAMEKKIEQRTTGIQSYCWDEKKGFYFDYHHINRQVTNAWTLAAVFPLFFDIASPAQADKVAQVIKDKFLQPGGLVTTLITSGQQWDAPNGWAPLQWMTYQGLVNYGQTELATAVRTYWMHTNEKVYSETGKMMEKYNVMDANLKAGGGEYPNQDGFGWTNGVYLKLQSM